MGGMIQNGLAPATAVLCGDNSIMEIKQWHDHKCYCSENSVELSWGFVCHCIGVDECVCKLCTMLAFLWTVSNIIVIRSLCEQAENNIKTQRLVESIFSNLGVTAIKINDKIKPQNVPIEL